MKRAVGIRVDGPDHPSRRVIGERRHTARAVLLHNITEQVAGKPHRLAGTVGPGDELTGGITGIGQHPAVEVGLPDKIPGWVVVVAPDQPGRVRDRHQPQLSVIGKRQPCPVRAGPRGRQVEVGDLGAGHQPGRVDILDEVALGVIGPPLGRTVREGPPRRFPLHRPAEPGDPTERVGHRDHAAEPVPLIGGDRPRRIGDRDRQADGIRLDPPGMAERIGDSREPTTVIIGERRPRPGRVGHRGQVAPAIVEPFPAGTVGLDDRHRQP